MSANKVTFGLRNVHIAFFDEEAQEQPAWKTPIPIPGAVRWTPTAEGQESPFYADDVKYYVATSNDGYTGELEMALVPDEILAEMLGWEIDDNGALVENADGKQKPFALMFEVQGDQRNRRFVYYNCQANRPAKEQTTKADTITVNTDVLNLTIVPIEIGGKLRVKNVLELSDTNQVAYDSFFDEVYLPVFGGTP